MQIYLWTEDQKGKSGYTFWTTLMGELFPDVIVESKNNNRGLIKAVKNITEDHNLYIIAYDQSFDNDQIIRETKKIIEYSSQKRNVILLNMICFEYILLEFEKLSDWVFAEEDDFRLQRADLLKVRIALLNAVRQSADYKRDPMIVALFDRTKEYNIEQSVAKLLYLITRNTGFEVSKSKLGECWQKNCCEFVGRQSDDLCGLDLKRLGLKEKMQEVMEHTCLKQQLKFLQEEMWV